jgi:tetratricopeptide (TPR) repeat protein
MHLFKNSTISKRFHPLLEQFFMEQETLETYQQAVAIYETALKFTPNDFKTLRRLGMALEKLSQLHDCIDQNQDAIDTLKQAIAAFETAFAQTPDEFQ